MTDRSEREASSSSRFETLRDVVSAARDRDGDFLVPPDRATPYSESDFATGTWKAGNLLHHYGVRPERPVTVAVGPKEPDAGDEPGYLGAAADPLLAMLGGMVLGAPVEPVREGAVEAPALVVPDAWRDRFDPAPGTDVLAYGGPPEAPEVLHFERERWSENPVEPPEPVDADAVALVEDRERYTHGDLVTAARAVAADHGLDAGGTVRVAARVDTPAGFVAGVLAPLAVGATVVPVAADELGAGEATLRVGEDGSAGDLTPAAVALDDAA